MGIINAQLNVITAKSRFQPGSYVWFGQPNQIPDPDNPATLKIPYLDPDLTQPASAIQGLDSDSKFQQTITGFLYGSGLYSIRVMTAADNTGTQLYYIPEVTVTATINELGSAAYADIGTGSGQVPLNSDLGAIPKVINFTSATGTVEITDTLPSMAVGDRVLVRKLNATQGAVTITCTGHTFTHAALANVQLNSNGDFWLFEKVSSTRLDIIAGQETGENANGKYYCYHNGDMTVVIVVPPSQINIAVGAIFSSPTIGPLSYPKSFASVRIGAAQSNFESTWAGITASSSLCYVRMFSAESISVSINCSASVNGSWY